MLRRVLASTALFGLVAVSAHADPAAQIKTRQDYFHSLGGAMKGLNDVLRSPAPSKGDILKYTATLNAQAPKLVGFFPAGTGPDSGLKTGARAEIWRKPAEFNADAQAFAAAAVKLNATAQGGDPAALKAALAATGGACKTCHQAFRKEDH